MNQKGISLIFVLVIVAILSVLASALFVVSTTDTFIARNSKYSKEAFYAAEAGLRYGERELRQLKSKALINGIYRNGEAGPNYGGHSLGYYFVEPSTVTDPSNPGSGTAIKDMTFCVDGSGSSKTTDNTRKFSVLIANNDPNEVDATGKKAEVDNKLFLRSIGYGPGNSRVILEELVDINEVVVDVSKDQALSSPTGQDKFNK